MKSIKYKGAIYKRAEQWQTFDVEKAQGHKDAIEEHLQKLFEMFRHLGGDTFDDFDAYPYAGIISLLSNDHHYISKEQSTIQGLINRVEKAHDKKLKNGEDLDDEDLEELEKEGG